MFFQKKKIVKELGKSVSWDEWDNVNLPIATKSHILTLETESNKMINCVANDLVDFDIINDGKNIYFMIHTNKHNANIKMFLAQTKITQLSLCMSDDPCLEHAGDWMQLGCMRILYVLNNPTFMFEKDCLIVICKFKDFALKDKLNEIMVDKT